MKNIIASLLIFIIIVTSCQQQNNNKRMKLFENNPEFINVQNSLPISFLEAEDIYKKYHDENMFNELETLFYYYENGFYYFGYYTDPLKDKLNISKYFIEAKVNGQTGILTKVDEPIDWEAIKNP
ncbi:MAG: hypothetical protein ACK5IC_10135 [Moheibacter sp.]